MGIVSYKITQTDKKMGCSGSKATAGTGSKKKVDDNKILQEAGLETLSKPQLASFNKLFKAVFDKVTKDAQNGGPAINIDMTGEFSCPALTMCFDEDDSAKAKFDQHDADTDGLLSKAEGTTFLKAALAEDAPVATDELLGMWADSIGTLNTETKDKFSYPEFERSKKILTAWFDSPKSIDTALSLMPPEQAKMMRQMLAAAESGDPMAAMGAMGAAMANM